jgi:hypothetical protein
VAQVVHGSQAMTPTLMGRFQTRTFLTLVIGGLWTLVITFFLPFEGEIVGTFFSFSTIVQDVYPITFTILITAWLLGLGWEVLYHGLMQFRWEKDWPAMITILNVINEGILLYLVVRYVLPNDFPEPLSASLLVEDEPLAFLIQFVTTYYLIFAAANSFMRIVFVRWRFRYGRLI